MPADKPRRAMRTGRVIGLAGLVLSLLLAGYYGQHLLKPESDNTASLRLTSEQLDIIGQKYGAEAKQRFITWQALISSGVSLSETDKLRQVNDFFNRNERFVDDLTLWLKNDYWATPSEFLAQGAGDCEDFSIAKYFTLIEMGVSESRLRITYVKALTLNQAHMVLTYFATPQAMPLILDNLLPTIRAASERKDLVPVYSFNGSHLWLAKAKGNSGVSNSDKLSPWADLTKRMLEKTL